MTRTIVLTGATRGLGLALAEGFIEAGHTVLGCGRSADAIAALRKRFGSAHVFAVVDVARDDAVERWARELLNRHPAPDLLVNNAALIHGNAHLWEIPTAEFDAVIDVNIKGVVNVIRAFVPTMIARGSGVIVNFSSGWGRAVDAEVAGYCASKWAIEGLTKALALELPEGLAAVPLNPGIIDTEMLRRCFGEQAASYPSPKEWASRAVPFLLRLGPADNGKSLTVPGGAA